MPDTSTAPGATQSPRLLLLDGHSLAYRAFFALPVENFTTVTGQHTNAVYGFTSMLVNVLRDEQPTHVAVAFDKSRQTFRLAEYAEYKAGRNKTPDEFRSQLPLIQQLLDSLRIPFLELEGFEADDIIATLAATAGAEGFEVLIVSGDRDAFQLVTDTCTVLYPMRGVSELARMTPAAVQERYAVPPHRYPELAALVGESSDNLPGVPGVGQGFAAKWINQFDGLDNVIARADEIGGKKGESLRAHLGDVMRNRHLNALVRDLDLSLAPADLVRKPWDRQAGLALLDDVEFRGELRARLTGVIDPEPPEEIDESGFEMAGARLGADEVAGWLNDHAAPGSGTTTGVSVLGLWRAGTGEARTVALATPDGAAAAVETSELTPQDDAALARWLADPEAHKVMHDANGQLLALAARGWQVEGLVSDTALAAYLVQPDQRAYDLSDLTLRYLKRELRSGSDADQGQLAFDEVDDSGATAAMLSARAVLDLADALDGQVSERGGEALLRDVELPLVRLLVRMEQTGIAVDSDHLESLEAHFAEQVRQAAEDAYAVVGKEINLGSPKQLQVVLFDELEMPKTKRTKTGWTTDADALAGLYEQTEHPFLQHLLRHRDVIRLRQTIEGLLKTVQSDGRIHTTFNQLIAATGRLSSTDPNLQNIPVRTAEGRRIRQAFVAPKGYKLLAADYSQIELRIMAHLSQDKGLLTAFAEGKDIHKATAAEVFGVPLDQVTSDQRRSAKAINFGLIYGMSAFGLARQLGIPRGEAQRYMDLYFERYPGVLRYMENTRLQASEQGYVETLEGRRLYLADIKSSNGMRRKAAEREAINAPMQGTAADIIKKAMIAVDHWLQTEKPEADMLMQVHDELVFEVKESELEKVQAKVQELMEQSMKLDVPLKVEVGVGFNWDEAH